MPTAIEGESPAIPDATTNPLQAQLEALQAQIAELQRAAPKIVRAPRVLPERPRTYQQPDVIRAEATKRLQKGQSAMGQSMYLDTPEGRQKVAPEYRPVFYPGDTVYLNLDAKAYGDDRTWGEIAAKAGPAFTGVGEIIGTALLTKTWEPKYRVSFPGLTQAGGGGFRESELLPGD